EDGIRAGHVTGVQTCALPISALWFVNRGNAQEKTPPKYEYAVLKWDGPDRLYYNLPDRFEMVHLEKQGIKIPGDAQNEEWCLARSEERRVGKEERTRWSEEP